MSIAIPGFDDDIACVAIIGDGCFEALLPRRSQQLLHVAFSVGLVQVPRRHFRRTVPTHVRGGLDRGAIAHSGRDAAGVYIRRVGRPADPGMFENSVRIGAEVEGGLHDDAAVGMVFGPERIVGPADEMVAVRQDVMAAARIGEGAVRMAELGDDVGASLVQRVGFQRQEQTAGLAVAGMIELAWAGAAGVVEKGDDDVRVVLAAHAGVMLP